MQTNDVDAVVHEERNPSQNIAFLTKTKDRHETETEIEIENKNKNSKQQQKQKQSQPLKRERTKERKKGRKQAGPSNQITLHQEEKNTMQRNEMQCKRLQRSNSCTRLVPGRRRRPVPEHRLNRRPPLILKACRQLLHHLLARAFASPHLRLPCLGVRENPHQPVVPHPRQAQPRQVPAAVALRVRANTPVRLGDDVGAQGVVSGQAAELNEELVARYIVNPG